MQVQFAAPSFVLGHYVKNFRDVLKIGWLPINERRDLNLLKSCFKALHNTETWPDYLKIIKQGFPKELCSSNLIINEEMINSTRNMIYSLKVFYFLLYRCQYFLFVSELI